MRGGNMITRFEIADASMQPALESGDWVIARRASRRQRGDVVVFRSEAPPDMWLVKRIVGLPGETVTVAAGRVHIDDRLLNEPWANGSASPELVWAVPEGACIVLGDNRTMSSSDSRTLGPIALESIVWRVVWRYWPADRIGRV